MPLSQANNRLYTRSSQLVGQNAAGLDIDGLSDIGEAIADADLFIIDNGGGGTNTKTAVTRLPTYVFSGISGAITINSSGVASFGTNAEGTNLTLSGNLTVNGTTTNVSSTTVTIDDPLFALADNNSADTVDIGWYGKYVDSGTKYSGLFRDASDSDMWKLFSTTGNSNAAPSTTVDTTSGFVLANLSVNELTGTIATAAQGNITSLGTLSALTVDDIAVDGKAVTMTGSSGDTAVLTVGTNGTLDITTTDTGAAAANIQITADGTAELAGTTVTLDSEGGITLDANGGTITFADDGASLGTITSSGYSGTSAVATLATTVTITDNEDTDEDNAVIFTAGGDVDGGNLGLESDGTLTYNPSSGTLTSTTFAGNLTGNASGSAATVTTAAQTNITSLGTLTGLTLDGNKSVTPGDGAMIHVDTSTITDSNTSGSGTAARYAHIAIEAPTLAATNSSVTTSDVATVYINNAATAGTNQTITRNWGLWLDAGNARFDGSIYSGTTEALSSAGLVTVANQSNITGVGTITSGTWQGTTVAVNQGGTGATSLTNLITLASHTTGDYVQNITGGTGLTSTGATSGENIAHSLSVDASQTQITAVGTIATGVWEGTDVGVSHGGTGASTATAGFDALSPMTAEGDVLYGGTSGTVTKLAKGDDGEFLKLASGVPTWGTVSAGTATGLDATSASANLPIAKITNTHADATAGYLKFIKDPGSGQGADGDILGTITFFGTDASNNAPEELARMESSVVEADHGSEAGAIKFYVAENDATMTAGLQILGQATADGEIDVTIGAGAASTTTIAGTLTMGSTAAMTTAGLLSVANQSNITGLGTITSGVWNGTAITSSYINASQTGITALGTIATGTWEATDVAVAHGGTGASSLTANAILTGNGTSAIQAETDLLFSSNKLIPTATAHNAAGTTLTVSAGTTTAGTTNNIAGGALTFQGGQGKGSGAGGAIIFQTANASGSGSSLNALATALTINDDLSITTAGTIELGHASDTTIARASSGDITIEGNAVYRAGGTDVAIADGGTGAGTATAGFDALSPMTAEGDILYGGSSGTVTKLAKGSDADVLTLASGVPSWATPTTGDITGVTAGNGLSGGGNSGGVTLALDLSELTDTAIANGDYVVFTDTTDSNATVKGDLADVATLFAGTGLTASSSVIGVDASQTQITAVGTIATGVWEATDVAVAHGGTGASTLLTNAILTGNGTSAVQAESTLLFSSNKLIPTATAHNAAGTVLTMSAGATTAGTTNNIAGGALTFQGGQGKGSGAGGDIIFQTANAGGSGSSLNALATALTISDDLSATFGGGVVVPTGATVGPVGDTDLVTLTASGSIVTVAGELSATTLDIGGTNIAATATELNLLDGGTSVGDSITVADADGFVVNDAGTMKTIPASDIKTYTSADSATKGFAIAMAVAL